MAWQSIWEQFSEEEIRDFYNNSENSNDFFQKMGYTTTNNRAMTKLKVKYNWIKFPKGRYGKRKDITGMRFGKLVALYPLYVKDGNVYWKLHCDCGNEIEAPVRHLTQGYPKSCGCYNSAREKTEDISGQTFSYLTVLYPDETIRKHGVHYICRCNLCGNLTRPISRYHITNGIVKSCGCLKSNGELNTRRALDELGIKYIKEYSFPDLYGDKLPLRFDFALIKDDQPYMVIECNGEQHYKQSDFFGGEEGYKKLQRYDKKKQEYCLQHSIKMIIIDYQDYAKINASYLKSLIEKELLDENVEMPIFTVKKEEEE